MDDSGGGNATITDVWHAVSDVSRKLGKIEADIEHAVKRIEPVEAFAKGYTADRNRLMGAVAAIAAVAAFIVTGIKTWVMSLVNPT